MKKLLVLAVAVSCYMETAYACGGFFDGVSFSEFNSQLAFPLLLELTTIVLTTISLLLVWRSSKIKYRKVVLVLLSFLFLVEILVLSNIFVFDQCVKINTFDFKDIVIPRTEQVQQ
jgi:hypothetical protein